MMLTIPLRRAGYRCAYTLLRGYWFLVRPRVAGVLCLIVHEHQLLLIRNTYGRQGWTFPGGMMKRGEFPEVAVRREVQEEVGITLDDVHVLGRFTGRQAYRRDTVHVFVAEAPTAAVHLDDGEILAARWFPMTALPLLSGYAERALQLWQPSLGTMPENPRTQEIAAVQQKKTRCE